MRTPQLLTCLLLIGPLQAQLVNGSFEDGTNGWMVPCECAPAYSSSDVAPGTGNQCIGLENVHLDCDCMLQSVVDQPTPWVTLGSWQLSGWIKSAVPGDIPGSRIAFGDGPAFSTPAVANLWSFSGAWEYVEASFTVENSINLAALRISLVPDDGNQQPLTLCYFDDIQLSSPQSVDASTGALKITPFRPNPAADKLWVDLPDAPISVTAIDATGRTLELKSFTHRDHTLEVDVNGLPGGITLLRITTNAGTQCLRFLKT